MFFRLILPVSVFLPPQVTYRVVQLSDQHLEGRDDGGGAVSVVSAAAFTGTPQAVAQVPEPFINDKCLAAGNIELLYLK